MPIYSFKCNNCKHEEDVLQKMSDAPPLCDKCLSCIMVKQMTTSAFRFKDGKGVDGGTSMAIPGHRLPKG